MREKESDFVGACRAYCNCVMVRLVDGRWEEAEEVNEHTDRVLEHCRGAAKEVRYIEQSFRALRRFGKQRGSPLTRGALKVAIAGCGESGDEHMVSTLTACLEACNRAYKKRPSIDLSAAIEDIDRAAAMSHKKQTSSPLWTEDAKAAGSMSRTRTTSITLAQDPAISLQTGAPSSPPDSPFIPMI